MAAGTACRAAAEGSGHRLCACAAAEPANSRRWSAADDGGEGATVGRRRGLDRSVQAGAARRPCVRRRPTGRPRAAAASDGLLARSLHRVWARLRARPLRRGAGGRAAGAAPWRLIAATLAVIAAVHLPGARGQTPHYVELNEQPELTNEVCSRLRVPHTAHRTHREQRARRSVCCVGLPGVACLSVPFRYLPVFRRSFALHPEGMRTRAGCARKVRRRLPSGAQRRDRVAMHICPCGRVHGALMLSTCWDGISRRSCIYMSSAVCRMGTRWPPGGRRQTIICLNSSAE